MTALGTETLATVAPQRTSAGPTTHESEDIGASLLLAVQRLRLPFASHCTIAPIPKTPTEMAEAERLLCARERIQFSRCHCGKRRSEFLAGRVAAKRAVARALGRTDASEIEIVKQMNGAPAVVHRPEIRVSISHSASLALAIASTQPIGVDLEQESPRAHELVTWFFSERELKQLDTKRGPDWHRLVNLLWTRKEAAAKVGHWGGSLAFSRLDCSRSELQVGATTIRLKSVRSRGYVLSVAYEDRIGGSDG
jgi:phosphopantetheinyl transferase